VTFSPPCEYASQVAGHELAQEPDPVATQGPVLTAKHWGKDPDSLFCVLKTAALLAIRPIPNANAVPDVLLINDRRVFIIG
jgi:hypothetical protein